MNGISNWNYKNIKKFLKENDFYICKTKKGSHEFYKKIQKNKTFLVNVNRTKKSFPQGTMKAMIRQSGIEEKIWRKFGNK